MALTRKMLKAMGIEDEKIDQIIEAHIESTDALKTDIEKYRTDAEKLPGLQKELETAKNDLTALQSDGYKAKYDAEHAAFESFKAAQNAKDTRVAKETAYRNILQSAGVSDKRLASILKLSSDTIDGLNLVDGKLSETDTKTLTENVKTEWADFITTTNSNGANTPNPPQTNPGKVYTPTEIRGMTAAEINANWDAIKTSMKG